MNISEIRETDKLYLTPKDIAEVLGCQPYSINIQAKADPSRLGFPVVVVGTRVKIPTESFRQFMGI